MVVTGKHSPKQSGERAGGETDGQCQPDIVGERGDGVNKEESQDADQEDRFSTHAAGERNGWNREHYSAQGIGAD